MYKIHLIKSALFTSGCLHAVFEIPALRWFQLPIDTSVEGHPHTSGVSLTKNNFRTQ